MQTPFNIVETAYTPEALEDGGAGAMQIHASGIDTVKDTVRYVVRELGIGKRTNRCPWFVSTFHQEDREYFEQGIEKYYTLHFPLLSARALRRVDQMFSIACKETPDAL